MFESMLLLLLILGGVYLWQNALRARELARGTAHDLCARASVQLLDQTVALQRMRLLKTSHGGLNLRRDYRFDFSVDGRDRHRGTLSLVGGQLQSHSLPVASPAEETATANVIRLPLRPTPIERR